MVGGGLVSNASPATVTFAATLSMFTVVKEGVEEKACAPMLVIFLGISKVIKALLLKAYVGIAVRPVPIVKVAREVLFEKQLLPIVKTVLGIERLVNAAP